MSSFEKFKGSWKHVCESNSEDYRSLYIISGTEESPDIKAKDLSDNEEFEIMDIIFKNNTLDFKSYMPSTKRIGLNRFILNENGVLISEFTFTVVEELIKTTSLRAVADEQK